MTLTRLAFFKLLGAVGIAQDFPYKRADGSPCKSHDIIAGSSTGGVCVPQECELKEGEERCPIGHCQKPAAYLEPKPIWGKGEREGTEMTGLTMMYYEPGKWIAQHVCSVCGVVYVPIIGAK